MKPNSQSLKEIARQIWSVKTQYHMPSVASALKLLMITNGAITVALIGLLPGLLERSSIASLQIITSATIFSWAFVAALVGLILFPHDFAASWKKIRGFASIALAAISFMAFGLAFYHFQSFAQCWPQLIPLESKVKELHQKLDLLATIPMEHQQQYMERIQRERSKLDEKFENLRKRNFCAQL